MKTKIIKSNIKKRRENIKTMSNRVQIMRKLLYQKLNIYEAPGTWEHILNSVGLFCLSGLNGRNVCFIQCLQILLTIFDCIERQCNHLQRDYSIYLSSNGQINIAALTSMNIDYVAKAISNVMKQKYLQEHF